MPHYKRRKKLIDPKLQLKFALAFATTAGLAVLVQSIVVVYSMAKIADALPDQRMRILDEVPAILGVSLLITFVLLIPLSISVGILMSFRICGPLYNMRNFLGRIAKGEEPGQCRIRATDELHDFCAALNAAVETLVTKAARSPQENGEEDSESRAA